MEIIYNILNMIIDMNTRAESVFIILWFLIPEDMQSKVYVRRPL